MPGAIGPRFSSGAKKWLILRYLCLTFPPCSGIICDWYKSDRRWAPSTAVEKQGGYGGMIKSELIAKLVRDNPHLYQRDVERIVATVFDQITGALAEGKRVELRGFGAFSVKRRPARVGRNPRTGESVQVQEKFVPYFKTGKELRERLNRD